MLRFPFHPIMENFNPLSPHGERPGVSKSIPPDGMISIHSPRMGRDRIFLQSGRFVTFQSTLPAWGETLLCFGLSVPAFYFNPLSPHGERLRIASPSCSDARFQSTLPAWGETGQRSLALVGEGISIHSPRMGRDQGCHVAEALVFISIHSPRMGRDVVELITSI